MNNHFLTIHTHTHTHTLWKYSSPSSDTSNSWCNYNVDPQRRRKSCVQHQLSLSLSLSLSAQQGEECSQMATATHTGWRLLYSHPAGTFGILTAFVLFNMSVWRETRTGWECEWLAVTQWHMTVYWSSCQAWHCNLATLRHQTMATESFKCVTKLMCTFHHYYYVLVRDVTIYMRMIWWYS